jgi:hypothetical protein
VVWHGGEEDESIMKSLRSTLVLLAIVAIFGAYIYFNERGPIAEKDAVVLLRSDPQQVTKVVLSQNGSSLTLKKDGALWKVQRDKSPVAVPAEEEAVQNFLKELQLVQSPTVVADDPKNNKEFGLEKPAVSLQLAEAKIEFGSPPSFDATKVYARLTNSGKTQIAMLPDTLKTSASKPFADWRDKAALRVKIEDVQAVSMRAPALAANFEKTKSGEEGAANEWSLTRPVEAKADGSTVESLLAQLTGTTAAKFFDDNPKSLKEWGLDKPQAQVDIATQEGPLSLHFGKKTAGGYAVKNSLSPAVFEVPASLFGLINRPLRDWRDKKVVEFETDKIKQVTVTFGGKSKTFEQKDEKWREVGVKADDSAKGKEAADTAHRTLMDLLFAVQSLEAQDFMDNVVSPAKYGLDKPWLALKMDDITLQIGDKGKLYAQTISPSLIVLSPAAKESLQKPLDTLFNPKK